MFSKNKAKDVADILRDVRQKMYHMQNTFRYVDTTTLESYEIQLSQMITNVDKLNSDESTQISDQLHTLLQVRDWGFFATGGIFLL